MCSTPTLFNSGTLHSQLSSCYLTTVADDLDGIYQSIKENALLQKYAGGLGNDWTPVRSLGSRIKGTNGQSQGVIPFLKVVNDTAVAVNQGGKRKGAVCAYLETWHLDIEEFLDLRKNTGDERRRTHDMNTANWIPDLFMKRVMENGEWTLFSPVDVPDLHDKFGKAFEAAYVGYEAQAVAGQLKLFKKLPAVQLWRKMLTMLFETGHPWITFKDACNLRSPQQHVGVVHSSNLCTEITLNTSDRNCRLQPRLGQSAGAPEGWPARPEKLGAPCAPPCACSTTSSTSTSTPRPRRATPTCGTARSASASWVLPTACTKSACLTPRRRLSNLPTVPWSRLLPRLLGVDRTGPRARPLFELQGQPVGPGHPAARLP
jgi:hypothetical protein